MSLADAFAFAFSASLHGLETSFNLRVKESNFSPNCPKVRYFPLTPFFIHIMVASLPPVSFNNVVFLSL